MAANVHLVWHSELLAASTKYNSLDNLIDIFNLESLLWKQFESKYNSAMMSTRILLTLPKITKRGDTRFVDWPTDIELVSTNWKRRHILFKVLFMAFKVSKYNFIINDKHVYKTNKKNIYWIER